MVFASPFAWWLAGGLVAVAAVVAYLSYARTSVPLPSARRWFLAAVRFLTFLTLLLFLAEPARLELVPVGRPVIPVLFDQSESMSIADAAGRSRIEAAASMVSDDLMPALGNDFQLELWGFGRRLEPVELDELHSEASQSDLIGALTDLQTRYLGQAVAAVVVLSDGGDTGTVEFVQDGVPPIFTIGIGSTTSSRDRELVALTVGEPGVVDSFVDLSFSMVEYGFDGAPVDVRVFENGQLIRALQMTSSGDGAVASMVVPVSPIPEAATVYTVEIQVDQTEMVPENNRRSVLVQPVGQPRKVLLVEGAPGYEHSFLKRALSGDAGILVDAVIDKGLNNRGESTFYIQSGAGRSQALVTGFPTTREELFSYDAVFLANVDLGRLSSDQVEMADAFVSERGGGLLVMGARLFESVEVGLTSLETLLPLSPVASIGSLRESDSLTGPQRIEPTQDGEMHPVMRVGVSGVETRRSWEAAPALGRVVPMRLSSSGATVLATTVSGRFGEQPAIAVQRFGRGRTMVFAGEASWRWKMLSPSSDQTYERFWRQTARWLAVESPDRVMLRVEGGRLEGAPLAVDVTVVDEDFVEVSDAVVSLQMKGPGGEESDLSASLVTGEAGRYLAEAIPDLRGVYEVVAEATRDGQLIGRDTLSVLVGGTALEFSDPRRQVGLLGRVARASGGKMIDAERIDELRKGLNDLKGPEQPPIIHSLWDSIYGFLLLAGLLCIEWGFRRRWGLR